MLFQRSLNHDIVINRWNIQWWVVDTKSIKMIAILMNVFDCRHQEKNDANLLYSFTFYSWRLRGSWDCLWAGVVESYGYLWAGVVESCGCLWAGVVEMFLGRVYREFACERCGAGRGWEGKVRILENLSHILRCCFWWWYSMSWMQALRAGKLLSSFFLVSRVPKPLQNDLVIHLRLL